MLTKQDLDQLEERVSQQLKQQLKPIKEDISDIRQKMNSVISFFDREYLALRKRVEKIEEHLHIFPQ